VEILAAGDVVNVNMSGVTNYQPAAGVAIVILRSFAGGYFASGYDFGFTDGTLQTSNTIECANTTAGDRSFDASKFGITNTNYYYNAVPGAIKGFSGIQIQ
tara:strand:- start:229 stop:531 length:303 start_codon:yes stop_codon:yes gene_type:complete